MRSFLCLGKENAQGFIAALIGGIESYSGPIQRKRSAYSHGNREASVGQWRKSPLEFLTLRWRLQTRHNHKQMKNVAKQMRRRWQKTSREKCDEVLNPAFKFFTRKYKRYSLRRSRKCGRILFAADHSRISDDRTIANRQASELNDFGSFHNDRN